MQHVSEEVCLQQQGISKLEEIDRRLSQQVPYPGDESQLMADKISAIKRQVENGERERHELLQNLIALKDGFSLPDLPGKEWKEFSYCS